LSNNCFQHPTNSNISLYTLLLVLQSPPTVYSTKQTLLSTGP